MDTPISEQQTPPVESSSPPPSQPWSTWRALSTVFSVAVIVATLFTIWTPSALFNNSLAEKMAAALRTNPNANSPGMFPTPTARPQPLIGIVAGHWGNDSGSVCPDGLTEAEVNLKIATLVKEDLTKEGFDVDLLQEFDKRLYQYHALALVSIHNDSCDYINDEATGFKVAAALASSTQPEKSARLTACLIDRYHAITGLRFHYNSITPDMTNYHAFNEINSDTPAAIIEAGFLNLDRQYLTEHTDKVAEGIAAGILCYVHNEPIQEPLPSQAP
jgi:N-acetylmuramoyl-L-alanine amidase